MQRSVLYGTWPKLWIANVVFLYLVAGTGWILKLFDGGDQWVLWAVTAWFLWFVPMELLGTAENRRRSREPERVRTFSQLMQFIAHRDRGHGTVLRTLTGWDGFVTFTACFLGACAWQVVNASLGPAPAWIIGPMVPLWNWAHWHNRTRTG